MVNQTVASSSVTSSSSATWWKKFVLPRLKTKEPELVGTPLWNDLLKAVRNQKNPNPRERFWHLSRSALRTLAERRTDPQG